MEALGLPAVETSIDKLYFGYMNSYLTDVETRVMISMYFEDYVLGLDDEDLGGTGAQERMLRSYAVYRYSTYYWTEEAPSELLIPNGGPISDFMDYLRRVNWVGDTHLEQNWEYSFQSSVINDDCAMFSFVTTIYLIGSPFS